MKVIDIIILVLFCLVPIGIVFCGISLFFQYELSWKVILGSFMTVSFGIIAFFALNIHNVLKEIFQANKKELKEGRITIE